MLSLTLKGSFDSASLFTGFQPETYRESHAGVDTVLRLVDGYRKLDGRSWLIEVLLLEDGLRQAFGVLVVERGPRELLVKLSELGSPHPTFGVKRAVFSVGRWLMDRQPDLALAHENLGADALGPLEAG